MDDTFLFRSKPTRIEAVQWDGHHLGDLEMFFDGDIGPFVRPGGTEVPLHLLAGKNGAQGWVPVPVGHWIVRQPGDLSDHWPVDPGYFAGKYETDWQDRDSDQQEPT